MKKKLLASAIASALVVGVSAQAADVEVSGQVSRVIVLPDDAKGDQLQFLDNNIAGSRFRFKASQDIGNGMKAGARLEAQFQSNKGNNHNGGTYTDSTDGNLGNEDNIDLRYQDLYLSGAFGKVSLGKGDGAGNGATEVDLSGTYIVAAANGSDLYGGFLLSDSVKVGDYYDSVDAYSRNNRLRYDSNNFSGLSFAASYGQQEVTELAVKFAGGTSTKYEVQAFAGTIGESAEGSDNGDDRMGLSGSVLLSNGLNATVSWSEKDADQESSADRENMWLKLGYKTGKHAFTIDYGETENTSDDDSVDTKAETMGVSYVFAPAKGVELFAGYREYTSDDVAESADPELITVGSRVKF
jgi:predicted porin